MTPEPTSDAERDRAILGEAIDLTTLDVPDGALMVVKVETRILTELLGDVRAAEVVEQLAVECIRLRGELHGRGVETSWVMLHPLVDLAAVDVDEMAKLGWVPKGSDG